MILLRFDRRIAEVNWNVFKIQREKTKADGKAGLMGPKRAEVNHLRVCPGA